MNTYEEQDEEELIDHSIQLSIQNSCQDAFLKSAASLTAATDESLRVLAAIEQGEVSVLREMLSHTPAFRESDRHGWLPLHRAAAQAAPEVLETVLRVSLEERTVTDGETPLTLAVKAGLGRNVKSLLEHGASPHNANGKNETPLLLAVRAGSCQMASTLVTHGAWVEQVCQKRWTAMHEAAERGNVDILMLLLRNGGRVNQKDVTGVTPLAVAAEHGHRHVIEILLNCGGKVNSQACNGESVLSDAAGSGSTECIQLLLDHGANPSLPSITGHLPIHKAAYAGHYEALKLLIQVTNKRTIKESGQSPVHSAAEGGHSHCLQLLLAYGFDVNFRMNTRNSENYRDMRRSALYFAVSNEDVECTKILLEAGAKPDLDPLSCLLVAVRSGSYEIVKLLLGAKADVNCCFTVVSDTLFPTALQYCLKDEVMMRLLCNNGYRVDSCFQCHHDNTADAADHVEGKIPFCEFMSLCCLKHLSGSVIRILLDYVSHVRICPKLRLVLERQKEWPEICETLCSPRSLGHLCRLEIRKRLTLRRLNSPEIISNVFPPRLKRFLLYEELDLYSHKPEHILSIFLYWVQSTLLYLVQSILLYWVQSVLLYLVQSVLLYWVQSVLLYVLQSVLLYWVQSVLFYMIQSILLYWVQSILLYVVQGDLLYVIHSVLLYVVQSVLWYVVQSILFYWVQSVLLYVVQSILLYVVQSVLFYWVQSVLLYVVQSILFYWVQSVLLYVVQSVLLYVATVTCWVFLRSLVHMESGMDAADDMDEDELLDDDVQTVIRESRRKEQPFAISVSGSETVKLASVIKQGDTLALQELCDFPTAFRQADERGWYPLHRAAVQPLLPVLEMVLYASFSLTLEEKTLEGETFLTLAAKAGLVDNVKMLLEHGASPHTTNGKNESPLLLAVRAGSLQMTSSLIAAGAQVEQVCLKKWTAVHEASRAGCVHVMELLLQNGGQVTETDQHGVTPLGIAAEYSHPEVLELLIKHGADVNAQAPNGDSVLYDAAGAGNPDCIDILLRHAANPNVHNLSSQLPIHRAAYEGHYLALRILIPVTTRRSLRLSGQSPLHSAADGGHAHCLELLLQKGFDVNALLAPHMSENYGDMRKSSLYFAVSNGDATCTDVLLKMGAKPDLDPLHCLLVAVRAGRYEIVKLLLAAGADVNCYFTAVSDTVFPTALQYCLKDEVMLTLLLNNGYDAEKCFCCDHGNGRAPTCSRQEAPIAFCDFISVSWLVNLVGRVVSVLLDYVGQVSLCCKLKRMLKERREWPHIRRTTRSPRSLAHLSRVEIRKTVSCRTLVSLHLPNRLMDYLLFKEKDLYGTIICRED
ncbi:LOW QUALITY PROTEIN: uncharacterized protein FYW49_000176 [Xenentodon cancila]